MSGFYFCLAIPEEGPVITGRPGRHRFRIGDVVRFNCTSAKSRPPAMLSWFINGEPVSKLFSMKIIEEKREDSIFYFLFVALFFHPFFYFIHIFSLNFISDLDFDKKVNTQYLRVPHITDVDHEGLETAVLGLEFRLFANHFKRGDMKIKCLATIGTVYWKSNEQSVESDKPLKAPVMESRETRAQGHTHAEQILGNNKKNSDEGCRGMKKINK